LTRWRHLPHLRRPKLGSVGVSDSRRITGLERMAQTEVRQGGADYNRHLFNWKR
jgi:hypothetical protein